MPEESSCIKDGKSIDPFCNIGCLFVNLEKYNKKPLLLSKAAYLTALNLIILPLNHLREVKELAESFPAASKASAGKNRSEQMISPPPRLSLAVQAFLIRKIKWYSAILH